MHTRLVPSNRRLRLAIWSTVALAACLAGPAADAQEGTIEYSDLGRKVSIRLPRGLKSNKDLEVPGKLGAWFGAMFNAEKRTDAKALIAFSQDFRRAKLAFSVGTKPGKVLEGTVRSGPAFHEHAIRGQGVIAFEWHRYVEKDGYLYHVKLETAERDKEKVKKAFQTALDTFTVKSPPKVKGPPEGWEKVKDKIFDITTDQDDSTKYKEAVEPVMVGWKSLDKVLPGKPFMTDKPKLRMYRAGGLFTKAVEKVAVKVPEFVHYDLSSDTLYLTSQSAGFQQFPSTVRFNVGQARLRRHVGGAVPGWLSHAIGFYTDYAGRSGKPNKLPKKQVASLKAAGAKAHSLDLWMRNEVTDMTDGVKRGEERFLWLFYLLHGKPPKDAKKAFEGYLQALTLTGDLAAAEKAWEEVDFEGLLKRMKKWAAKLK